MATDNQLLADFVVASKYSNYIAEKKRREIYEESTLRVTEMHRARFDGVGVDEHIDTAEKMMLDREILGSQRALQFGGDAILKKNARMYNCTGSYCDRAKFFQEVTWVLLCGCGAGFSVQRHHIAKLPAIARPKGEEVTYVIPDTIEGWADSVGILMSSYFVTDHPFPEFAGKWVNFDFSLIRPLGAPLSYGGKAPGPDPLKKSLEKMRNLLQRITCEEGETRLNPIDAYDLTMYASDAVVAGGVRRSACLCAFSADDEAMARAKTGRWNQENPQRGRSNNSAVLLRDGTDYSNFFTLIEHIKEWGEPGFLWVDDLDQLFNPCVEIGLWPKHPVTGETGWAFCNLTEINVATCSTPQEFYDRCHGATILGTLQAAYTDFGYLGQVTKDIVEFESLIGVSMTGMMQNPDIALDPEVQRNGAKIVLDTNEKLAAKIGIKPCARGTCIKPAGSTSCVFRVISPGIHYNHAHRYFRTVQTNKTEPTGTYFKELNPLAVEESVWNVNKTDWAMTFRIETGGKGIVKRDMNAMKLLDAVKLTQENWVGAGKVEERCAMPFLTHNVSNTVDVADGEWEEVVKFIYVNRHRFTGVTLLSDGGDLDFPQAPFCEVLTSDEVVEHYGVGAIMSSGLIVDGMHAFDDDLWAACGCALGKGEDLEKKLDIGLPRRVAEAWEAVRESRRDWVRRAIQFADRYFDGNTIKMTRCLKRVHNCKRWEDLGREMVPVDYTQMREEEDNTTKSETIACGGKDGSCRIAI